MSETTYMTLTVISEGLLSGCCLLVNDFHGLTDTIFIYYYYLSSSQTRNFRQHGTFFPWIYMLKESDRARCCMSWK